MRSSSRTSRPEHQADPDDEILALALQLEEIASLDDRRKGKYKAGDLPDDEVALSTFRADVQQQIDFHKDAKIAHSIARAVAADGRAIGELVQEEARDERDRARVLQLSGRGPGHDPPPPYVCWRRPDATENRRALTITILSMQALLIVISGG